MYTASKCTIVGTDVTYEFNGKSTDIKPFSTNGSKFIEMDTGKEYFFDGDEKGWSERADKYLDSIAIETAPTKTAYYEGSNFDPNGMTIQATYTDGTTTLVDSFEVVANAPLKVGDIVQAKYVENGRTRLVNVAVEIKTNVVDDAETLIDIFANGNEAILGSDVELHENYAIANDFVLDLNGHRLETDMTTEKQNDSLFYVNGCTMTFKGGEIVATNPKIRIANASNGGQIIIENGVYTSQRDVAFTATGEGSKVVFNGGTINAVEGGIMAFTGATLELNNGKVFVADNFPIGTNGTKNQGENTIIMNGGYYEGHIVTPKFEAIGVYIANNDTFIMNDGEINVINGAGLLMRGGTVVLNGGKIKASGVEGGGGWIGDQKTKMSQSAIIYDEKSKYPGREGMNLTVNGGTFVGFDKSIDVQSTEAEPKVTVNGGAFVPPYVPVDEA